MPLRGQTKAATGISLNEDNSHYYFSRAGQKLDAETVASFIDQYAGTQMRELMLSPNSQRTSYGSYDPAAPDDQPLLRSMTPEQRVSA